MTSSSASESTWRTLYGSAGVVTSGSAPRSAAPVVGDAGAATDGDSGASGGSVGSPTGRSTRTGRVRMIASASSGVEGGSSTRWNRYRKMSRAAAVIGNARIAPSSPPIAPPMTSATMTIVGCSSTASPWIFGTSRLFSTCWMTV